MGFTSGSFIYWPQDCGHVSVFESYFFVWKIDVRHQLSFIYLFIFGCAGSWLLHGLFFSCGEEGLLSSCQAWASLYSGFSCCSFWAPEHRFSSHGAWAQVRLCTWDLPRSEIKPCLLHWQMDSLPLSHQGSPQVSSYLTAATAKSLQSCLTVCNPIDGSRPGSPVPGILQARALEWVAISFSNA